MLELVSTVLAVQGTQLVIGGAMGGIARWIFLRVALYDGLSAVVLGGILGFYVSPYVEPAVGGALSGFTTDQEKLPTFAAFFTGVAGISIVGFLIDWVNQRAKQRKDGSAVHPPSDNGGEK